jgi:phage terminase small subunit
MKLVKPQEEAPLPRPPRGLTERSNALWRGILADYDLTPPECAVLEEALRLLDRASEARAVVDRDGPVFLDRWSRPKVHPMLAVERDMRALFIRNLRELGLDPRALPNSRPPAIPGRDDD